jgi:hypothetical protein
LSAITITRSAPSDSAGLIGVYTERQLLLADVLAQLIKVDQLLKRPLQRFGVQDRRSVEAAQRAETRRRSA